MSRAIAQVGKTAKRNRLIAVTLKAVLISLALFSVACATYLFAAPNAQIGGTVTASPRQVYTGELIEISLKGFTGDFLVPAGAVTLGGVRVPIPGTFGNSGVRPRTDSQGDVTFTSRVPLGVPYGPQDLLVDHFAGGGQRGTTVITLQAEVSLSPSTASPNQTAMLRGSGFSPVTIPGGKGMLGVHQITGQGISGITVNGRVLAARYVTYPIDLDSDGGLATSIILPESYVSFPGGTLEVTVVDDAGRSGVVVWNINERVMHISPEDSGRRSKVTVTGTGFLATGRSFSGCAWVEIAYGGVKLVQVRTDSSGSFQTSINVPGTVALGSSNTVTSTISGCPAAPAAKATHKVPARSFKITPLASQVGTEATVTGVSFLGFTTITKLTIGDVSVLPAARPIVAEDGSFSITVVIPKLTPGSQSVKLAAADVEYSNNFVVLDALPVLVPSPTPAPTATPAPTPAPTTSESLAPLNGNLLSVWAFDETSGKWNSYNPKADFANVNTLPPLVQGQLYWMRVKENQTVSLNGRKRNLFSGWNLVHW